MGSPLDVYYSTNYSKCYTTDSFIASSRGLAISCHAIQIVALPFQILTFYILMKKTPAVMNSMKTPLLVNHLCCFILDVQFCTLTIPYIFVHSLSAFGAGLFSQLGVSNIHQLVVGVFCGLVMASSYIFIFESRSSFVEMNRFRIRKTATRVSYHALIIIVGCTSFVHTQFIPGNQDTAKLEILKTEPCPTKEFFARDVLIIANDPEQLNFMLWLHFPLIVIHICLHIIFHVSCTVYYLYVAPSTPLSPETKKIQIRFLVAIIIQMLIPLTLLIAVFLTILMSVLVHGVGQTTMNAGIVAFSTHGLVESVTVVMVHQPFRKAAWDIVKGRRSRNRAYSNEVDGIPRLNIATYCFILDVQFCTLTIPYFFVHTLSGFGAGLFSQFGVPNLPQFLVGIFCGQIMASSYIFLFERRSSLVEMNRFRIRKTSSRVAYHALIILVGCTAFVHIHFIPDNQDTAKLEILKTEPCPMKEFFVRDVLIIANIPEQLHFVMWFHFPLVVIHICLHIIFHVSCTVHYLYVAPNAPTSPKTRKFQIRFLVAIIIQMLIPLTLFVIMFLIISMSVLMHEVSQTTTNAGIVVFSTHGLVESVTVVMVHQPFRRAVWEIVTGRKSSSRAHSNQVDGVSKLNLACYISFLNSLTTSAVTLGTLLSLLFVLPISETRGRKFLVVYMRSFLTVVSALFQLGSAYFQASELFILAQFFDGIHHPLKTFVTFVFVTECAPDKNRGFACTALLTLSGIVKMVMLPVASPDVLGRADTWFVFPLSALISCLVMLSVTSQLPESPKWLVCQNRMEEARDSIEYYHGEGCSEKKLLMSFVNEKNLTMESHITLRQVWDNETMREGLKVLFVYIIVVNLNISNIVATYYVSLHQSVGFTAQEALNINLVISIVSFPCQFLSTIFVDWLGRRPVMLIAGGLLYLINWSILTTQWLQYFFGASLLTKVLYVFSECVGEVTAATGIASLRILFITELFPPSARTSVSQAMLFTNMALHSGLLAIFPILYAIFPPGFFVPFIGTTLVGLMYLYRHMPETNGKAVCAIIEDLDEEVMSRTATFCEEYTPLIKPRTGTMISKRNSVYLTTTRSRTSTYDHKFVPPGHLIF